MRYITGKTPIKTFIGILLFLICCGVFQHFREPDPQQRLCTWLKADQRNFNAWMHEGLTTEAEVEHLFGCPIRTSALNLSPDQAKLRGIPLGPNGQSIIVFIKVWPYDDGNNFNLEIDERGVVVRSNGPFPTPPRSAFRRWWYDFIAELETRGIL